MRTRQRKAAPEPSQPPTISFEDARRLCAAHELLVRVCADIAIKAEGSSKLTRALEDAAHARDTLWHVSKNLPRIPVGNAAKVLSVDYLDQLAFSNVSMAAQCWDYWRKKHRKDEAKHKRAEAEQGEDDEDDDDDE